MADSSRRVEFADLDWLFFIPNNQRTSSLMACTCGHRQDIKCASLALKILLLSHKQTSIADYSTQTPHSSEQGGEERHCGVSLLL